MKDKVLVEHYRGFKIFRISSSHSVPCFWAERTVREDLSLTVVTTDAADSVSLVKSDVVDYWDLRR